MFKHRSSVLIVVLTGVLAACGGKLLWEARVTDGGPKVVTAAAVDQASNTYVGGSMRNADNPFEHEALLIKHDPAGALLWQTTLDNSVAVVDVEPLTADVIAVATGPYAGLAVNQEAVSRELWLVSAATGEPLTLLHTFTPDVDGQVLHAMKATDGRLYVISGAEKEYCAEIDGCRTTITHSVLRVFDSSGNLTGEKTMVDQEIADIAVDADHNLNVLVRKQNGNADLQRWDSDLQLVWTASSHPSSAAAMAYCKPVTIKLYQQDSYILCAYSVVKLDSTGAVVFETSLEPLLEMTGLFVDGEMWANVGSADYLYIEGLLELDDQGNALIAKVRPTTYFTEDEGTVAGIPVPTMSTLSSDAMTIKVSGQTGEILWSKTVGNAVVPDAAGFKSYYHYPLNLALQDDQVMVTLRSFGGVYNYCGEWLDWDVFFVNVCTLINRETLLGRTVVYNTESGKRIASKEHAIPYPRKAMHTPDGHVLVVGDMESGYWNRFLESVANGEKGVWGEEPDIGELAEISDIVLQKYKF